MSILSLLVLVFSIGNRIILFTVTSAKTTSIPSSSLYKYSSYSYNQFLHCPVWAYYNYWDKTCKCLEKNNLRCGPLGKKNYTLSCYCLTFDEESSKTEVGQCFYNCDYLGKNIFDYEVYDLLAANVSTLDKAMCNMYNRTASLCGQCRNGTYLPTYSYTMTCKSCGSCLTSWITQ